jgi:predicted ATP-dependent serine protease
MDDKKIPVIIPLVKPSNEVKVLKDIKVPDKFFNRLLLGVQVLDEIFGGAEFPGILPGSSILFTGHPGAGKSTAALQFADLLQRHAGRNILYNVGEENEYMIRLRADRLGVDGNFGLSNIEDVDELVKYCKGAGVEVLFQDSLQSLRCGDLHGRELLKVVTKKLHTMAKDDDITVFIIGHITKGGDFAGPMEVKHDVDVHAHIKLNPDNAAREFNLTKNRFGPSQIPYEFSLTRAGLDFKNATLVEAKEDEDKGSSKANERREKIEKIITEYLLKEKVPDEERMLSGYCFQRLTDPDTGKVGIACSGGYWRSMLEKVRRKLEAEGHIFGEVRNGPGGPGRTHIYVEI